MINQTDMLALLKDPDKIKSIRSANNSCQAYIQLYGEDKEREISIPDYIKIMEKKYRVYITFD